MDITKAFASLAVDDLDRVRPWYEQLFGPADQPMPDLLEWSVGDGGGLQVYRLPERAGQGSCTLVVDDIDAAAETLRSSGVAPDATPARGDNADTVMIRDPDGNSIAFAEPKDPSVLQ